MGNILWSEATYSSPPQRKALHAILRQIPPEDLAVWDFDEPCTCPFKPHGEMAAQLRQDLIRDLECFRALERPYWATLRIVRNIQVLRCAVGNSQYLQEAIDDLKLRDRRFKDVDREVLTRIRDKKLNSDRVSADSRAVTTLESWIRGNRMLLQAGLRADLPTGTRIAQELTEISWMFARPLRRNDGGVRVYHAPWWWPSGWWS